MGKSYKVQQDSHEVEIQDLLAKMTVREKIGQLVMIEPCFCVDEINKDKTEEHYDGVSDPKFISKLINDYHIGLFLFGGVSTIGDDSPEAWAGYINEVNSYSKKTRLKIPMLYGADAVHGVNFIKGSTIFSHNLGVTSSWNPELVERYANCVSNELSGIGFNCNFAPTVDVARDQRWGRVYESLGEDPYLASIMSESLVIGMQKNKRVVATAKHFVGYGESSNGMDRTPADLSDRSILETHIPPFRSAINAGVQAIMVNGGDVNGVPMPVSKKLMTDMLRKQLGFKGVTMSDWEDVYRLVSRHKVVKTRKEAIAKAFNAGLDMNMAVSDLKAVDVMEELVEEGSISIKRLNEAAGNVLRVKFNRGLFISNSVDVKSASLLVGSEESKKIAKQMALESLTLLKNENSLLPLSKNLKSILVTGNIVDSKRHLCGGWTLGWASAKEEDLSCKTIIESIKEIVSSETKITYISDIDELKRRNLSKNDYDVCINIVGEEPHSEWLGDSMSMDFEKIEEDMLKESFKTGIPVVMVSVVGRPQQMLWADEHIPAILWAFLPGTEGAMPIAETLFGDYNPSGKLTISFPKDANQIPVVYNARRYECHEITTKYDPLYPFGYGLSYTEFEYSQLKVPKVVKTGMGLTIEVTVKNTGNMDGAEVVQVYLKDKYASVTRPLKSLKAFKKVFLQSGKKNKIRFEIGSDELSLYDEYLNFVEEKREIEVQINNLKQNFELV